MNSPMGFANKKAGIGEGNAEVFPLVLDDTLIGHELKAKRYWMAASLVLDDRACHYPQPRGGRDGMCDDAFMWGMWLGRGTAVSSREKSRE